jgi:hypothetical protein
MSGEQEASKQRNASCPECGYTNPIGAAFCDQCGASLESASQEKRISSQHVHSERAYFFCAPCGHQNRIGSRFCDQCGAVIKAGDWEVQVSGANALEVQTVAQALMGNIHRNRRVIPSRNIVSVFLAANPAATNQLRLDEEIRAITEKIRVSEHRDMLELTSMWATRPDDLLQALNQHRPHIVHFSGHGSSTGEIILVDNSGNPKPVTTQALKALFTTLKDNIRVVVLNACYSQLQARAITEVIDCAIGMNAAIGDKAAIVFAASFYRAIGFGRSVQEAFDQGKTALLLEGIPEENTPELLTKIGVDPHKLFLISPSPAAVEYQESVANQFPSDASTWPYVDSGMTLLRIISGPHKGTVFELNRLRMIVGRYSLADISIPNEHYASRIHFALIWDPETRAHFVEDMGHINRIAVNKEWVLSHSRVRLKAGDEIRLGSTVFRYEQSEAPNQ